MSVNVPVTCDHINTTKISVCKSVLTLAITNILESCFFFTVKYKLPSALFSSHVRLNNLWSALEGFPGEGLEVPEACGLHPSPEVSEMRYTPLPLDE